MARAIADHLDGDTDVVLVRKLRAPGRPEFAIGSVDESGREYLRAGFSTAEADVASIAAEKTLQVKTIKARRAAYSDYRESIDPQGRVVIVIDDGLATGSTMIAALRALRVRRPERLICAVPVAPAETVDLVRGYCDEVVCLHAPGHFYAVGQFYRDFPQVTDQQVIQSLRRQNG